MSLMIANVSLRIRIRMTIVGAPCGIGNDSFSTEKFLEPIAKYV